MKFDVQMSKIINLLERNFLSVHDSWIDDPFQVLIATILSQNTNERNSNRAFLRFKEYFDLRPEILANLTSEDIKPAITCAGLSNVKSRRIVEVSQEILKRFNGDLTKVFSLPLDDAREALMDIKGIGPKTADVFLAFVGKFPVMPVDTNIFRVVNRIGLIKGRNYEQTRKTLEEEIPAEKLLDAHIYLIKLGRELCKPHKPLCQLCPINTLCDYGIKHLKEMELE